MRGESDIDVPVDTDPVTESPATVVSPDVTTTVSNSRSTLVAQCSSDSLCTVGQYWSKSMLNIRGPV